MSQQARLEVFQAQTANVRRLEVAVAHVKRSIHLAMRKADQAAEEAHSLVYALLYCAWLEALFLKLVHTPYGFSLEEIGQILSVQDGGGVHKAWCKCVELGLRRVPGGQAGEVANMRRRLFALLDKYALEPAQLRNKIAHGQWQVALNRQRTGINKALTAELALVDVISTDKQIAVVKHLTAVVEALVESPRAHFRKAYWMELAQLEETAAQVERWTRDSRMLLLKRKPIRPREPSQC